MAIPSETVTPGDSLLVAIRKMGVRGVASLPVTEPKTDRLLGLISRAQILALYERAVAGAYAAESTDAPHKGR